VLPVIRQNSKRAGEITFLPRLRSRISTSTVFKGLASRGRHTSRERPWSSKAIVSSELRCGSPKFKMGEKEAYARL
jgi:hypothetical protein